MSVIQPVNKYSITLGQLVVQARSSDNFINATQMCKAGGKKFTDWRRLSSTKELITTLEESLPSNAMIPALNLIDSKQGGDHSGSWIHPDLAVQLAQWISPTFAIKVSRWVRELFLTGEATFEGKSNEQLEYLQRRLEVVEQEKLQLKATTAKEIERRQKAERTQLRLQDLIASTAKLEQNEVIYIATSTAYENQNRYKVGGVGRLTSLPTRIQSYQTGRAEGDEIFCAKYWMVHSYSDIEKRIKTMLARFKDNRARDTEMYHLHGRALYETLEFIITNSYQADEWFNGRIEQFVCATGQDEPYKSERINLKSAIKLLVNEKEYDVVDITGWSEDKVQEEVERILTLIAESKGKPSLRGETIEWRDISSVIQSLYKRPRMTDWRVAFQRQVPRRSDRLKIKGLRI